MRGGGKIGCINVFGLGQPVSNRLLSIKFGLLKPSVSRSNGLLQVGMPGRHAGFGLPMEISLLIDFTVNIGTLSVGGGRGEGSRC